MPLGHLGGAHIFRGEFPRFSRDEKTRNPTTKAFGGHFLWHPLAPPLHPPGPRTHCRQIPGTPRGGPGKGFALRLSHPPAPPCTPLPPLAPPGPAWPLAPPCLSWPSWVPPRPPLAPPLFGPLGPPALAALLQKRQVPACPCGQGRGGN